MSSTLRQSCKIKTLANHFWRPPPNSCMRDVRVGCVGAVCVMSCVGLGHARRSDRRATDAKKLPTSSSEQGASPFHIRLYQQHRSVATQGVEAAGSSTPPPPQLNHP